MSPTHLDAAAYRTAERLLRHNRGKLVRGGDVRPRWLHDGARLWYPLDSAAGRQFVMADPADGTRAPAFDHPRLAASLAAASGTDVDPAGLPFAAIDVTDGSVEFDAWGARWRCGLDDYTCVRVGSPPARGVLDVVAPDGAHAVFREGHDIRARSLADGRHWPLTEDGTYDRDYGANPDYFMYSTILPRFGLEQLPPAAVWSPDSSRVLTHRTDQRDVRRTHLVDAVPADGAEPRLHTQRFAHPGDPRLPLAEFVVLHIASGKAVFARSEAVEMPMMSPVNRRWAWWAQDGSAVYYLAQARDMRTLSLRRMDPETGEVRTLVSETGTTRVEPAQLFTQTPMVEVLPGEREVVWYSQRDGWGHLYLYGTEKGELRGQITSGPWAVQRILHVDEARRTVYFLASGLFADDPYRRSVCRVGLDGSGFARVTDDDLDHVVTVPPGAAYFVDAASDNATPPVTTVRGWAGEVLVELERADATGLVASGWSPPERFRVTAADGRTHVHGMLYRPHGFDPARRYPVLDHPYWFPNAHRVSPSFDPGHYGYEAEALAALGFVVIAVDGRGAPGRSKEFHDASFGRLADAVGLADHAAALEELGRSRPWMDLGRVGAVGASAGGFAVVRAMLDHPHLFKVGVAEGGMHDLRYVEAGAAETYQGPFEEKGYAGVSNVDRADRLAGDLLLVHGGMDDSVSPHLTLRLVERLIAADKDFELLIVPGADHSGIGYEHYVNRRKWDFLVRHLMGVEPPRGYRLTPVPMAADAVAGLFG
ncbi:S9 family peptidase [Streptomyces ziwulingensis]|uniref:DPP IV N-terminal domain-containing protein n=1 Tax=Streptomyces ziwulingensis TaxID=1045501 RepID=A0ABP9CYZ2_9ACTN